MFSPLQDVLGLGRDCSEVWVRGDGTESPVVVQQEGQDGLVPDVSAETRVEVLQLDRLHLCGKDVLTFTTFEL